MRRLNFSALKSVAYPASWPSPKFRFGQRVRYLDDLGEITGMRWCIVNPGDQDTPPVYEWRYEIDHVIFVPAEVLEPAPVLMEVA